MRGEARTVVSNRTTTLLASPLIRYSHTEP